MRTNTRLDCPDWPTTTIAKSSYLRGRIGWQGLRASEFLEEGPYLITGTDFVGGKVRWGSCYHVSEERYAEAEYIHIKDSDVLITKDGTIGKIALVSDCPDKAVLNSGIFLLRCQDGSYDHGFMFHLLNSHIFRKFLEDNLAGSTINHLYQNVFEKFPFPIPEIEEQSQIATILSTLDLAIEQTEAIIAKQQRIKAGLMQDLLTKGIDEHGIIRSEATHQFKDSPLGRIPVEWDVAPMAKYGAKNRPYLRTGPFGSSLNTKHWVEQGVPVFTIGSLGEGVVLESELLYISEQTAALLNNYRVVSGDIVFSRVADVGRALVVSDQQSGWIISSNFMRISLDQSVARPLFLYCNIAFNSAVHSQLRTASNAGGRDLVNGGILSGLVFPWPSPEEQDRINNAVASIDVTNNVAKSQLANFQSTKAGLMHDLLTGTVRVKANPSCPPLT